MNISLKQKLAGLTIAVGMIASVGCSKDASANVPQAPPPEVEVATVEQRDVPIYREWIGTLDGMVNAAIKAEVSRLSAFTGLHRRFLRAEGPTAVRDRSAALSRRARSG